MNTDNLELASMRSRALAFVIDDFLITFLIIMMYWSTISNSGDDIMSLLIIMNENLYQILMVKFIYQTLFVWYYGATIGKIIAKIRVVDYNNFGRVSVFTAMTRSLIRLISEMFFYIGFIFGFFSEGRQTLHDKIGRTLVVNA